jgi:aminopyrrolnitrin oxygenase
MIQAPAASRFAAYPATWYRFGTARELRRGLISRDMLGRRLVAFRTTSGRLGVLDARCAHLGADLAHGCVEGESIRCPFHSWEYDVSGRCTRIPGIAEIPPTARQVAYPALERHGHVFFFNGREPLFPLPFFAGADPDAYVAGRPFRFIGDCSWYMLTSNGFDAAHFESVHDRTLLGPAKVDCPAPFARRMRYRARVTGHSIFDRLLRRLAGDPVEVSITSWGGPLVLVTGWFRRARSYIWIAARPLSEQQTLVEIIPFAPRSRSWLGRALLQPLGLGVRRWFTRGFMQDDIDRLGGIRYNPAGLVATDQLMIEFFDWLASLPQTPRAARADWHAVHEQILDPVACEDRL